MADHERDYASSTDSEMPYHLSSPPESSGSDTELNAAAAEAARRPSLSNKNDAEGNEDTLPSPFDTLLVGRVKRALMAIENEGFSLAELRWADPPRVRKGTQPEGGATSVKEAAFVIVLEQLTQELANISSKVLRSPANRELSAEELTSMRFSELIPRVQDIAPQTWSLLRQLGYSARQEVHNTRKNPDKKALSIYVKFKGLSAKAFDTLHASGLVMSHKWTGNAVDKISKRAMDEVATMMEQNHAWLISHDNIQLPFRVYSQRSDHNTMFGNGTAATVYFKRSAVPPGPEMNAALKSGRAKGLKDTLTAADIGDLENAAAPRIRTHAIWEILRFLLESPEFDFATYSDKSSAAVQRPAHSKALPHGKEHATLQRMLGSVDIAEASYEDNERLITEWLRQLGLSGTEKEKEIGLKQVIFWVGDQLTVDRLRGLYKFHAEEFNAFDRLDWLIPIFGWLHLMMAYANSLHKQYLGTGRGYGLSRVFDVLARKGLHRVQTKGIFYHDLNEAIYHVTEAHLRVDWKLVTGVM
ncbi:hypothetical protein BD626DRAFT_540231 [Schizophyllum amplum]|uniref:DUF6589 domain-containing protein n=1 Tax=Schizophyllum amplum TaxID=97359 RepID=A0A550BZJ8_9AGAR|nr:hypothetical protein BD626DRAFT_540231 [Auriculariopsis ampla]